MTGEFRFVDWARTFDVVVKTQAQLDRVLDKTARAAVVSKAYSLKVEFPSDGISSRFASRLEGVGFVMLSHFTGVPIEFGGGVYTPLEPHLSFRFALLENLAESFDDGEYSGAVGYLIFRPRGWAVSIPKFHDPIRMRARCRAVSLFERIGLEEALLAFIRGYSQEVWGNAKMFESAEIDPDWFKTFEAMKTQAQLDRVSLSHTDREWERGWERGWKRGVAND